MAKKKKKEETYTEMELRRMKKGETYIDKSGKWRSKKYRIPKWLSKHNDTNKSIHLRFRKKYGRFANNEERILMSMFSFSDYQLKELSKQSKVDYSNISRYLKSMEKKKLITIKKDYRFKKQASGTLKTFHTKEVSLSKKGRNLKKDILGYWV